MLSGENQGRGGQGARTDEALQRKTGLRKEKELHLEIKERQDHRNVKRK